MDNSTATNDNGFMFSHSSQDRHIIIIERGEKMAEVLNRTVAEKKILGGMISGLGALKDVELGYYDLEKREYIRKTFSDEDYELISLNGNISLKDGQPYCHVHASLGRSDFSVFGGHLFEATVAVTCEISIVPMQFMPERLLNPDVGIATICKIR